MCLSSLIKKRHFFTGIFSFLSQNKIARIKPCFCAKKEAAGFINNVSFNRANGERTALKTALSIPPDYFLQTIIASIEGVKNVGFWVFKLRSPAA